MEERQQLLPNRPELARPTHSSPTRPVGIYAWEGQGVQDIHWKCLWKEVLLRARQWEQGDLFLAREEGPSQEDVQRECSPSPEFEVLVLARGPRKRHEVGYTGRFLLWGVEGVLHALSGQSSEAALHQATHQVVWLWHRRLEIRHSRHYLGQIHLKRKAKNIYGLGEGLNSLQTLPGDILQLRLGL